MKLLYTMDINKIYELPRGIQLKILNFYYKRQSKELCEDIKSFINTRDRLMKHYRENDIYNIHEHNYLDWLANDITAHMNNYNSTIDGFTKNHIQKWKRLYNLKNKTGSEIYNIISLAEIKMPVIRDIWTRIGILKPEERIYCSNELISDS